jgi:hypothetical protein
MNDINLFQHQAISQTIQDSFNDLLADEYLQTKETFRQRRYSTGSLKHKTITWDENAKDFFQSKENNVYVGGVFRAFAPVAQQVKQYLADLIIPNALKHLPKQAYNIGVHQIRTLSDNNAMGQPAPEGIHQDGFDYIMVTCIKKENITGGDSLIFAADDYSKIKFDGILEAGESVLFNDKTYAHYASPIVPKIPGVGYRDVFVTTFKVA